MAASSSARCRQGAWGQSLALLLVVFIATGARAQNATAPCPEGWTGPACALCTSAAACGAAATCSTSLAFAPTSQLKSWSCAVPGGIAAQLIEPGSLLLQCSTGLAPGQQLAATAEAAAAAPPGNCTIGFLLASSKAEVKCTSSSCTLVAGQPSLVCSNTTCACPADATCGGNPLVSGLVGTVSGDASLLCDAAGTCSVKLGTVLNTSTNCTSAECLPGTAAAPAPQPAASPPAPVVAASPPPAAPVAASPPPSTPDIEPGSPSVDGSTCSNPESWEGHGCVLCKTDAACFTEAYTGAGSLAATCSRDFRLANNTMLKSYSCDVAESSGLSNYIKNLLVQCRTGLEAGDELPAASPPPLPSASPPAAGTSPAPTTPPAVPGAPPPTLEGAIDDIVDSITGRRRRRALLAAAGQRTLLPRSGPPMCQISFQADVDGVQASVMCAATNCTFVAGSTDVQCVKTECACPDSATCGDSATIKGLVDSVNKNSALECPPLAGGEASTAPRLCKLKLAGMIIDQIDATCEASECLVPTSAQLSGNGSAVAPQSDTQINTNPIIAAIPLMVLVLITLLVGTYTYSQRHMWGYRIDGEDVAQLEALAAKPAVLTNRVGELVFENLTVSVPLRPKDAAQKAAALRRKAMVHKSASRADTLAEMHSSGLSRLLVAAKAKLSLPGHMAGGKDLERAGEEGAPDCRQSADDAAASAAAADFVVGLHQPQPDRWHILSGCSGSLRGGEVVGVLGPSGCGKTTLLGSIAGSAMDLGSSTVLMGNVTVDGHRRRNSQVAYVPQSDVLIPSLTVQECLRYSALLRLPQDTSPLNLQVHIERVLDELGLRHIADAQVGGSGGIRGVSGGERRRVTIGMELVTDPSILVLDEPTSGLDSYTADNLMHSLKVVASAGRVVLASLHQPSRDVFCSLDQVVLMGHGRMLYMGPPALAEGWFERHGLPCPAGTAIAEHMLRIASDARAIRQLLQALGREGYTQPGSPRLAKADASLQPSPLVGGSSSGGSEEEEVPVSSSAGSGGAVGASHGAKEDAAGRELSISKSPFASAGASPVVGPNGVLGAAPPAGASWRLRSAASSQDAEDLAGLPAGAGAGQATGGHKLSPTPSRKQQHGRKARYGRQLSVMFWRTLVDIVRNPALLLLHCVVATAMGLVTGLVFFNSDNTNVGVQNRMGGTFFALAFLGFTSLTTVDLLINERQVVSREVRGGYYNPSAYLLSKLTLDALLLRVLPALLYFFPFYYLAGFQSEAAYAAAFCFILVTFSCVVGAMSMSVTVASNTAGQASFAMNFLLLFSLVFTGFLVNVNSIPGWIRWIHYLSVFYYAFEAMINGELSGMVFTFQAYGSAPIPNVKGETFLQTLGFEPERTTIDIGVLVGIYFLMVLLALALFYLRLPRQATSLSKGRKRAAARRLLTSGGTAVGSVVRSASGRLRVATSGAGGGRSRSANRGTADAGAAPARSAAEPSVPAGTGGGERKRWQFFNPAFSQTGSPQKQAPAAAALGASAGLAGAAPPLTPLASGPGVARLPSGGQEEQKKFRQDFKQAVAAARQQPAPGGAAQPQ